MRATRQRKRTQGGSQGATQTSATPATIMADAARRWKVPLWVLVGVKLLETGTSVGANATSSAGAQGDFQFMPGTAASLGVKDPNNFFEAANGSAKYLRQNYEKFGSWNAALEAYNGGPGAVGQGYAYTESDAKAALRDNGLGRLASTTRLTSLGDLPGVTGGPLLDLLEDVFKPGARGTPGGDLNDLNAPNLGNANPISGLESIGDFIATLGKLSTWLRIAEVLGGGVLIYLALKELTGTGAMDLPGAKVARAAARI